MTTGTVFLSPGSSDLFFSGDNCFLGLSAAVFTIGEIFMPPANGSVIWTTLRLQAMKASYFFSAIAGWLRGGVRLPAASSSDDASRPGRFQAVLIIAIARLGTDVKGMRLPWPQLSPANHSEPVMCAASGAPVNPIYCSTLSAVTAIIP